MMRTTEGVECPKRQRQINPSASQNNIQHEKHMAQNFSELANFIWSVADILRGDYKQGRTTAKSSFLLRRCRFDRVLESTKPVVLAEYDKRKDEGVNLDIFLKRKTKLPFYNVSPFTVPGLLADPNHIRQNLIAYIGDFSADARDVFERSVH